MRRVDSGIAGCLCGSRIDYWSVMSVVLCLCRLNKKTTEEQEASIKRAQVDHKSNATRKRMVMQLQHGSGEQGTILEPGLASIFA